MMFGTRPAHGSQDAWAVGHMLLVMLTKRRYRASNMFKHNVRLTLFPFRNDKRLVPLPGSTGPWGHFSVVYLHQHLHIDDSPTFFVA